MHLSKICQRLFRILLSVFMNIWKMCTRAGDDCVVDSDEQLQKNKKQKQLYTFRAFKYEEVKPKKDRVPFPRSGHRIGADSSNFYSFGGYNPMIRNEDNLDNDYDWVHSYPLFQELWKYNYARREWIKYPNSHTLPLELASNALLLHRNHLMVYGGTGSPFGFRCSNQLFVCRVNDDEGTMSEIHTTGQLPLPLYGQALIYHNDYLYTIGGTTGLAYTCDIHRLNMKTMNWEIVYLCSGKGDYEPMGRYRHEVGFDNKNIYVLGGGTADAAYDFHDIPVFDLEKNHWYAQRTKRDNNHGIPPPRRCHGAVQVNTETGPQIFITGGHDGTQVFDDLWRLDLITFQWSYFPKCHLPSPTYFHATAATPEGKIFVFGGIRSEADGINGDVIRDNRIYATWLCIPKLSEICWEAVLHYSPDIVKCKSQDLINVGLPRHFVQRLTK